MKFITHQKAFSPFKIKTTLSELLLMLDYGIFYEFIPMDIYASAEEKAIPLSEVDTK